MSGRDRTLLKFVVVPFVVLLSAGLMVGLVASAVGGSGGASSTATAAPAATTTAPRPSPEHKAAVRLEGMLRVNWRGLYKAAIPGSRVDRPVIVRSCHRHNDVSGQQGYDCVDTSLNSWHIEISTDWYSASAWSLWVRWLKPQMTFCDPSCGGVTDMGA